MKVYDSRDVFTGTSARITNASASKSNVTARSWAIFASLALHVAPAPFSDFCRAAHDTRRCCDVEVVETQSFNQISINLRPAMALGYPLCVRALLVVVRSTASTPLGIKIQDTGNSCMPAKTHITGDD